MSFEDKIKTYIKAGTSVLGIQTVEIDRATSILTKIAEELRSEFHDMGDPAPDDFGMWVWNTKEGWASHPMTKTQLSSADEIESAINWIVQHGDAGIYVMQNAHLHFDGDNLRSKDILAGESIRQFPARASHDKYLILLGDDLTRLPSFLGPHIIIVDLPLPTPEVIEEHITALAAESGFALKNENISEIAQVAVGMSLSEVESAASVALVESGGKSICRDSIFREKSLIVKKTGLLQPISVEVDMNFVGGFGLLKAFLKDVKRVFEAPQEAWDFGISPLKGCLLCGIPGTGKSLVAQAISSELRVPLFRLDVGKLFGGLVGQTEKLTRSFFRLTEAVSPCVIMIDEAEKAFAGADASDKSDSGITRRLVGSFLTWLQDDKHPLCYVVATANDVSSMRPEMLRPGRWDALWFVDLPTPEEQLEILMIHLRRRKQDLESFPEDKMRALVKSHCVNFTGAEIELGLKRGIMRAFAAGRKLAVADLVVGCKGVVPIVVTKADEITKLREWGMRSASPVSEGWKK